MLLKAPLVFTAALICVAASATQICDYTPSKAIKSKVEVESNAATVAVGATGVAGAAGLTGIGLKAAGIYAIKNAVTGAWMLGATTAGASAAGTTGIIAGTSGAIGTIGMVLTSPAVLVTAGVAVTGLGLYEGGCYIFDKR